MTSLVILAAGESSRLGQPKQNLLFQGKTLLQRAVESGQKSNCENIIVVLGANSDQIHPTEEITILYNKDWKEGMASSIRTAMIKVNYNALVDKVIIMLCDQPFVTAEILNALIDKRTETGKTIISSEYNGTTGAPVLFDRSLFSELLLLRGQEGAKTILKIHADDLATVLFEKGSIDIDTPSDYQQLLELGN